MYLNKAFVIGNLTRDPELKSLPSGVAVATFSLATNRVWRDAEGAQKEAVDYHNIVVFRRQAETCAQYLKKGQSVLVEGRIQTRSWDGNDGAKRYRTEIVADRVQFGPKSGSAGSSGAPQSRPADNTTDTVQDGGQIDYPDEEINSDDIPF
jgi:single-strand DNA-binding protein